MMKKLPLKGRERGMAVLIMLLTSTMVLWAQQTIQLKSAGQPQSPDKAVCVKSDMTSLKATFSFSSLEAQDYKSKEGDFSVLSLANTVIGGNEGDPQIPVINELISVPVGAKPRIEIKSFKATDYKLSEYDIKTLVPRQPSLRKDQKAEDVPFVYNKAAYQKSDLKTSPKAIVEVVGTMRGVRLGKMTIEPVSYNPVDNTLRVFNDIEVEVFFDGANAKASEDLYTETYSPYFDVVYKQLFNGSAAKDAYSEHPDLYTTPVKMLVITASKYLNNEAFQNWVTWKKQKGIYVDVYTTNDTGTTAANIKSFIQTQYAQNHPTFVVIVGDTGDVTYSLSSSTTSKVTDLYYSSTDGDIFPEIFLSRMPVSSTQELTNLLNKILTYEKYTMADPSYLDNVLLIAGADSNGWPEKVGRPTINYAANNYFNTAHGFANVYKYVTNAYTGCYNYLSSGVGFANYTAHGGETGWSDPSFSVSDANNLTNNDKYFWAMGNCCLAANWGYNGTCFAESLLRGQNKGAFGYIGSCPETYWYEDYYFGVGATTVFNSTPDMLATTTGVYDAMFDDSSFNTLNAVPFFGNVAVTYAHANNYQSSISDTYYWEAYHCLGDGSVMPYHTNPAANSVSHADVLLIGANTFTVSADAGSYVSITKNNEILGVAVVPASGMVEVPITPVTSGGDVMVVVTRNQRQPYMATINAIAPEGPYITLDSYTPATAHIGENALSLSFKNVGVEATTGTTTVTLSSEDENVTIIPDYNSATFDVLGAGEDDNTITLDGFMINIPDGVADGTNITLHFTAVNVNDEDKDNTNTWEGNFVITVEEAVLEFQSMVWDGSFVPGQTLTVSAKFKNTGHYPASNAVVTASTTSQYVTIAEETVNFETIGVEEVITANYTITIAEECPETAQLPLTFTMTADRDLSAQGTGTLKNTCFVTFDLADSYGDGWNGAYLVVSFDDGTPSEELTITSGDSANYSLEIGNGTQVTLTWISGSYNSECSFSVSYGDDLIIYQSNGAPSAGVLYQFDCNCAAAFQTFNVTATSSSTSQGTVSGGGEYGFGQSCTVTATPADGYFFTGWTWNGDVISVSPEYTFNVTSDMNLVANFVEATMIGDGGSNKSEYLPTYNYYNYSLTQQIYTVEELGAPGFITSLAFYNEGAEKTRNFDIYLKNTTKSSFSSGSDWVTVSANDKVFSGSVTMTTGGWTFITLSTPFLYDGTSNVVLVTDDNTGNYSNSPHMACRTFNATSQAIYAYNDGTNFNPSSPSGSGTVVNVKNQILITKESLGDCVRPTFLSVTETGPDFVKLSWTENGASDEWIVVCGERTVTANTNEDFVLDGLDPETSYTIQVCPVCDENLTSKPINVTTLVACPIPQNVDVAKISSTAATLTWSDYNDSYNVQLGQPTFLITENFDNGIPYDWVNTSNHPWTVVDGHIESGNAGVGSSTSSISVTVTYPADGTISFDFWARGEGSDTNDWDKCRFYIDNTKKFDYGKHTEWESYRTTVTAGTHTFKWEYKKDTNVNPDGDCFMVDNLEIKSGEVEWSEPIAVEDAEYTFTGLEPVTTYCVKVQGVCSENPTAWTDNVLFTTADVLKLASDADNSEKISAAAATNKLYDVTLADRTLYKDGDWNTLCLPFDITIAGSALDGEGVEAKTLTEASIKGSRLHLAFGEAVTTLEAGVPYIIKWANDTENPTIFAPTFEGVTVSDAANDYDAGTGDQRIRFIGTKSRVDFEAEDRSILFLGTENTLYYPLNGAYVGAQRAYFKIGEDGNAREIKGFSIDFGEVSGVTTGIFAIGNSKQNTQAGPWYSIDGRKIDTMPTTKGVYINNGRKVILH